MSGPSRMAYAGRPFYPLKPAFDPQIVDLADVLSDLDARGDDSQADGVVPPVFEALQSLTDYRRGSLRSSIPKYSTRSSYPLHMIFMNLMMIPLRPGPEHFVMSAPARLATLPIRTWFPDADNLMKPLGPMPLVFSDGPSAPNVRSRPTRISLLADTCRRGRLRPSSLPIQDRF